MSRTTYTKRFTAEDIAALGNDATKRIDVRSSKAEPRSWDDQAIEVRRLADHLLRRLSQQIDQDGASAELAKLSAIIRGHMTKDDSITDPSKLSDEELERLAAKKK